MKNPLPRLVLALVASILVFLQPAEAARHKPRWLALRNKPLVTFSWGCATTDALPKKKLGKVFAQTVEREKKNGGAIEYADRAFRMRLFRNGPEVCFVPIICGATGNCYWSLFTVSPTRFIGTINGQYIFTTVTSDGWPMIVTYGHFSASEGTLTTYVFKKGKYRSLRDYFQTDEGGLNGRPLPKFFRKARRLCTDYET